MALFVMVVMNSSLAVTRTVIDTASNLPWASKNTSTTDAETDLRVAVDGSGNARLVAWAKVNGPSLGYLANPHWFPTAHIYSCGTSATTFTYIGSIPYVKEGSVPFYDSNTSRFYINLVSFRGGTGLTNVSTSRAGVSSYLVDITSSIVSTSPARFRPAAVLGEYVPDGSYVHSDDQWGFFQNNRVTPQRPATDGYNTYIGYGQISTYGLRGYGVAKLTTFDQSSIHSASNTFSGGLLTRFDRYKPYDLGFVNQPCIHAVDEQTGTMANGTYTYVAVHSFLDRRSNVNYSRCSEPISVTTTNTLGKIKLDVSVPAVTAFDGPLTISLFRTISGGTQYYLVETRNVSTTATNLGVATEVTEQFTDTLTDALLQAKPLLYRAPGTAGTSLDRCNSLAAKHVVRHKDRYYYAHDQTVYFSSFEVDGESPWFSPGLSIDGFQAGTGSITGLASMDGTLVVFKKDAIFLVDGDGPPENGGSGNEFSTPRPVHSPWGCKDPRSIAYIPDGIVYRSDRGIELLTRSYKVVYIGQDIQNTVDQYAYVGGATFDKVQSRLYMVLSNTLTSDGGQDRTAAGVTIVYDTVAQSWTKFFHYNSYDYGKAMQDVCFSYVQPSGNTGTACVVFADHGSQIFNEQDSASTDTYGGAIHVPWKLATGWVRAGSKQDRIRVTDLHFLGRQLSGHNLKCQFYTDYNRSTATTIKTFDATATNINPEQLEFQPSKESVQSMKFVLTSETPTNPTTLGSGQQVEINGITIRVGLKGGGPKLSINQKG